MAKIFRGRVVVVRPRFSGFAGMDSKTSEELHAWADRLERRSGFSDPADDPKWLSRHAKLLRHLAEQKECARTQGGPKGARPNEALWLTGAAVSVSRCGPIRCGGAEQSAARDRPRDTRLLVVLSLPA